MGITRCSLQKILYTCGILSVLIYVYSCVILARTYIRHHKTAQTISDDDEKTSPKLFAEKNGKRHHSSTQSHQTHSEVKQPRRKNFNPPARITTSMTPYESHAIEYVYTGSSPYHFFWTSYYKKGDTIDIVLDEPTRLSRILLQSGNTDHLTDVLKSVDMLLSPPDPEDNSSCGQFTLAGRTMDSAAIEVNLSAMQDMAQTKWKCVRFVMTEVRTIEEHQDNKIVYTFQWLVISRIRLTSY